MKSLIVLAEDTITAIAIITAVIIIHKCSAIPIAVTTESIEKTRSRTIIWAMTNPKLAGFVEFPPACFPSTASRISTVQLTTQA